VGRLCTTGRSLAEVENDMLVGDWGATADAGELNQSALTKIADCLHYRTTYRQTEPAVQTAMR
jgi:hypothetical protein